MLCLFRGRKTSWAPVKARPGVRRQYLSAKIFEIFLKTFPDVFLTSIRSFHVER